MCKLLGLHPGILGNGKGNKFSNPPEGSDPGLLARRNTLKNGRLNQHKHTWKFSGEPKGNKFGDDKSGVKQQLAAKNRGKGLGASEKKNSDKNTGKSNSKGNKKNKSNKGKSKGKGGGKK